MSTIRPEFIRLPKPKTNCLYTGLSRTGLYNLTVPCKANGYKPKVPAKCLRESGNLRGIWLVPYEPLIAHLKNLPSGEQSPAAPETERKSQRRSPDRRTGK